ncbi:sarcosine oxidase subunit gamma [Litoreibacter ponti]|uniref:Sarcosine oxidase subunit gamma n=1 Tax=Litoreibacter ponti TaxID=1510457 RepID=A0A2T6BKV2_9RHOB|nr:sarcosine oxidase subunit gamma [Litoreibacter ponti]PTX56698.1 sarcosine oxidase subunit gamma [Litoreibacter ponti]
MIELVAKSPAEGLLPKTIGTLTLSEVTPTIHSIAPLKGARLKDFPDVGKSAPYKGGTLIWSARGQYMLLDAPTPKIKAAITDQSDAWTSVTLTGDRAQALLARLCPLDTAKMAPGDVARSLIGHMSAIIIRQDAGFQIMVFRAFARTLVHEMTDAMTALAARQNIPDTSGL